MASVFTVELLDKQSMILGSGVAAAAVFASVFVVGRKLLNRPGVEGAQIPTSASI